MKYVKLGSRKMMSLTCFEIVVRTNARVSYSFPGLMVFHSELVELKRMSMNLEIMVDIVSPIRFEIVARTPQEFYTHVQD